MHMQKHLTRHSLFQLRFALLGVIAVALVLAGCASTNTPTTSPTPQADGSRTAGLAQAKLDQGDLDAALALFTKAVEENPDLVEAHMGIGSIHRQQQDYEMASEAYRQATIVSPGNFDAHYYLGLSLQLLGNVAQAIEAYQQALKIEPTDGKTHRDLAAALLQAGRPSDALDHAQIAVEAIPDSQNAWYNLAAAHSLLKQYDKAIDAYRQAAELGELEDPVLIGLADAHLKQGNYLRGANTLKTLVAQSPSATAYERLGYAWFKTSQYKQALQAYRKANELDPTDTAALNGVGVTCMTLYLVGNQKQHNLRDQAVASWRRSVQLNPQQPAIVDLLFRYGRAAKRVERKE